MVCGDSYRFAMLIRVTEARPTLPETTMLQDWHLYNVFARAMGLSQRDAAPRSKPTDETAYALRREIRVRKSY